MRFTMRIDRSVIGRPHKRPAPMRLIDEGEAVSPSREVVPFVATTPSSGVAIRISVTRSISSSLKSGEILTRIGRY